MVNNKKSIKKIIIAAISLILVVSIAVACAIIFVPVKLDVDIDSIEPVGTTVRIIEASENNPVSIYKEDSDGEISDEAFKILSFTDTHLDANKEKGACTMKYFIANIQKEKPDLVVIDGDTVTGVINRKRAEMFAEVMEKLGVYWITTLGNHEGDNALSLSREDFVELYSSYPHCLIESGDKFTSDGEKIWGYGNTQINILTKGGKVSQSLFFIDSGNEVGEENAEKYGVEADDNDFIKESQIQWYKEQIAALDSGVKSMLFIHIPLCEYKTAFDSAPKKSDGTLDYGKEAADGTVALFGSKNEGVCCSEYNSGMFDAILGGGSTQAVVAGHDHVNNFSILYKGIYLCYNRNSGYSSYNAVTKGISDELMQGASIYTISPDGSIEFGDIINSERFDTSSAKELYS